LLKVTFKSLVQTGVLFNVLLAVNAVPVLLKVPLIDMSLKKAPTYQKVLFVEF
jgi:hypothetical protein